MSTFGAEGRAALRILAATEPGRIIVIAGLMRHGDEFTAIAVLIRRAEKAAHEDALTAVSPEARADAGLQRQFLGDGSVHAIGHPLVKVADEIEDTSARHAPR